MDARLILIQGSEGVLRDCESHLHNAVEQKINDQGALISDPNAAAADAANGENGVANIEAAAAEDAQAAREKTLAE